MSIRVMTKVWDGSIHAGSDLLMMLAIADFADDEGRAYPAVPTLAAKCRMKPRNANYVLTTLRDSGELEVRLNEGPKGTNLYRIVLERLGAKSSAPPSLQPVAPLQSVAPLQPVAETPAIHGIEPLQPSADEPSGTIKEPSKTTRARKVTSTDLDAIKDLIADVDQQVLQDWLALRKYRKAGPLSRTAMELHNSEAAKAGLSPVDAMKFCISANWSGFTASFYEKRRAGSAKTSGRHSGFDRRDYGQPGELPR